MSGDQSSSISAEGLSTKVNYEIDQSKKDSGLDLNLSEDTKASDNVSPGGFWIRFVAYWVDELLFGIITMVILFVCMAIFGVTAGGLAAFEGKDPNDIAPMIMMSVLPAMGLFIVAMLVARFFYFGWFYKNKGASPGKLMFGMKVLDGDTGTHLGYWRTFGRDIIGKSVINAMIFYIGFLMVAFTKDKKGLHDMIFNTNVVIK